MLFFTNHLRQNQVEPDNRSIQDFYHKTKNAVDKARGRTGGQTVLDAKTGKEAGRTPIDKDADGDVDSDDEVLAKEMAERLKAAEQKAKELANAKAPNKPDSPSEVIGVGSSAGGQVKKVGGDVVDGKQEVLAETNEEHELEIELDRILKKAPGKLSPQHRISGRFAHANRSVCSNHLFQILLPLLKAGKGHPARQIPHRTGAVRR